MLGFYWLNIFGAFLKWGKNIKPIFKKKKKTNSYHTTILGIWDKQGGLKPTLE